MDTSSHKVGPPRLHVVETEVDGDVAVYDPGREQVVVLNGTASDVWRLSDGEHTCDEIVVLLARAYGIRADDIRRDVTAAIERLHAEGLLLAPGDLARASVNDLAEGS